MVGVGAIEEVGGAALDEEAAEVAVTEGEGEGVEEGEEGTEEGVGGEGAEAEGEEVVGAV